jgi:RNA polymerase sigma-70 factor (ECF subfamily)
MGDSLLVAIDVRGLGTCLAMADESGTDRRERSADRDTIRQIVQGEQDLYADLIARHQTHVSKIVGRRVPPDRLEEVVHDVFVRAYLALAQYSGEAGFDHWLSGIAVRACYDFWRAQKREAVPVSAVTDDHQRWIEDMLAVESDAAFHDHVRRREATELLQWALNQLSPENRAVLTLVHLEGHSVKEAAALLGWSLVNVKVRAHRARQVLRNFLTAHARGQT